MLSGYVNHVMDVMQVVSQLNVPEPMKRTEMPTRPWQYVAVDLMGPMPTGENLLVVVDHYSRYNEVVITHSTTSGKITNAPNEIFARFGFPHSLKSDNGRQFASEELSLRGFRKKRTLNI